ncbi:hypothetical protein [Sporosarcina sp. UB5]|uniref:hypothetical protein n=1 Tax=Sporosarcina sp. UB5 TaxID=3047463 RepID=UPI003D7B29A1
MFRGQIRQLFPGQMAEVQIGDHTLIAKLEVPLKGGDAYYFQVQTVNPELQIKVVTGPLQTTEGPLGQLSNLMESMQLPKSPEMHSILSYFLKQKLPIIKENLLDAVALIKTVQLALRNDALNTIQKLVELKLPLNQIHFNSLLGVETKEGFHDILHTLRTALIRDVGVEAQLKETILSTLGEVNKLTASAVDRALVSSAILKLLDETAPREERFQVLQLLKNSGIMSQSATLANLSSLIDTTVREQVAGAQMKKAIQNDPVLQQSQKLQLIGLLEELENNRMTETRSVLAGEQTGKKIMRAVAGHIQSSPFRMNNSSSFINLLIPANASLKLPELYRTIEQSSVPIAKELIRNAQFVVEQAIDGKMIKDVMQSLFKSLGFNYEAGLMHKNVDISTTMDMLKPQLVGLLHDSSVSQQLRDAAEVTINRMNGTILQSADLGMNKQIVMQLPLEFLGKRIDATIQWNGRKDADGKIDADFARILFYLELESIKKTVVDMQVQNRVVAVTIFNQDDHLREIGNLLQGKLRDGLESVNYRLSGVTFKHFEEEEKRETKIRKAMMTENRGVDFRI